MVVGVAAAIVVALLGLGFGLASGGPISSTEYPPNLTLTSYERAIQILEVSPVIDGHNDFPMAVRDLFKNNLTFLDFDSYLSESEPFQSYSMDHTDLKRLKAGHVGGQFWSAYVGCSSQYKDAVQIFLEQIDIIKRLVANYPNDMQMVVTAQGIEDAFAAKKIASLIGVESGHAIGSSLAVLRMLYELGARYMTLTHSCNTPWADSSVSENDVPPDSNGLSEFGKLVVKEMNRLGMLVDLSHVSKSTMEQAIEVSRAPVIFSHSSARTVNNNSRNVPDEVLTKLAVNRGIIMVNFYSCFLIPNCAEKNATVQDVVAHINHIRKIAGVDYIGLGGDYNGITAPPEGLEDVSKYPELFAALLDDPDVDWTAEDLEKLASRNLIRVFKEVEGVRDALKYEVPYQEWIPRADLKNNTNCNSNNY